MTDQREVNLKNGLIGTLNGYRVNGKSYDPEGNEIDEVHEKDCFCCRKTLFLPKDNPDE